MIGTFWFALLCVLVLGGFGVWTLRRELAETAQCPPGFVQVQQWGPDLCVAGFRVPAQD